MLTAIVIFGNLLSAHVEAIVVASSAAADSAAELLMFKSWGKHDGIGHDITFIEKKLHKVCVQTLKEAFQGYPILFNLERPSSNSNAGSAFVYFVCFFIQ